MVDKTALEEQALVIAHAIVEILKDEPTAGKYLDEDMWGVHRDLELQVLSLGEKFQHNDFEMAMQMVASVVTSAIFMHVKLTDEIAKRDKK